MKKGKKYKAQLGKNVFGDNTWKSFDEQPTPQVPVSDPLARMVIDPMQTKQIAPIKPMEQTDQWFEGMRDYHPAVKLFNMLAQFTTGAANRITDVKNSKDEMEQLMRAFQPIQSENFNEKGLNSNPIYFQTGGQANPIIEAESGEVYQNTDNQIVKIPDHQPTHEEGGVDIGNAERVLENTSDLRKDKVSKSLKLDKNLIALLTGYEASKDMSHSAAMEHAKKNIQKETKKIESKVKGNVETLQSRLNDKYANNSLKFNMKQLQSLPTEGQVFDTLFAHQELLKGALGIENDGEAKCGGKYKAQTGGWWNPDIPTYAGGKTPQGRTTPTGKPNSFAFPGGLAEYAKLWKPFVDLSGYSNAADAQGATYDYLLQNAPEALAEMWKTYGNTAQGRKSGILTKQYPTGDFSSANLTPEDLKALRSAYVDNMLGARTMTPSSANLQTPAPQPQPQPAPQVQSQPQPMSFPNNPKSMFNEPLNWFDIAGPLSGLLEGRIPAKYNPVELNQIRLKLQNPEPALQAGQRDYNAILPLLPRNGQGYANMANVFSKKYNADNQILGQYENANAQIKNQETIYNANVKDRQSLSNQQSRAVFEQQYLMSREAQRQQHATSLDELYTRLAQNRKLNREGNLLMQMFPAFDQYAQFNGYQTPFRMPIQTPNNPEPTVTKTSKPNDKKEYFVTLSNGKKIPFKLK